MLCCYMTTMQEVCYLMVRNACSCLHSTSFATDAEVQNADRRQEVNFLLKKQSDKFSLC